MKLDNPQYPDDAEEAGAKNVAPSASCRKRRLIRWPARTLGPLPGLSEWNLICWGFFLGLEVAPLCVWYSQAMRAGGFAALRQLDFVYFYGIGRIVNEYPAARLYDYGLQVKVFSDIFVLHGVSYGPSPYPPLVARFFSLLARLPFEPAYFVWLGTSLAFYLGGIAAAVKGMYPGERRRRSLIFCLAVAFPPFLVNTLANGQLASLAVCAVGMTIYQEREARPFCAGLAVSLLAYKPTLLLLIVPMLLLTRRFRQFMGLCAGVAALVVGATAFSGVAIWPAYARFLRFFGRVSGMNGASALHRWQFVDLNSLRYALTGGSSVVAMVILFCVGSLVGLWLAILLWKSAAGSRAVQDLAWAAALTWTLLLNFYVPTYDSVLAIVAVALTLDALRLLKWTDDVGWVILLTVLTLIVAGFTQAIAMRYGIQLLTVMLFVLGVGQLSLLRRAVSSGPSVAGVAVVAV